MNPIFSAALEVESLCRAQGWRFCFIGAVAVQRWGEPRLTQDVDLTLITGFGGEAPYVETLLERFAARLPDARDFALRYRVVLVRSSAGIPIDVALGGTLFEERVVERASNFGLDANTAIRTCSAEDLIVLKAFADRPQDWLDIEGVVARQGERLDEALIWKELGPLLEVKDGAEIEARLKRTLKDHS